MEVSEISGNQTLHDLSFYYIYFEITGYPRNMIGSSQCDLFMNKTFFSIFHLFQANLARTLCFSQKPRSVKIITPSE